MHQEHVGSDGSRQPDPSRPAIEVDSATLDVLRRLLTLADDSARAIRDETVRRRARHPQTGPRLDL